MGKINKWITALVFAVISTFTVSCSEQKLELYDTSRSALNIAKGSVFGRVADYPEEYAFNAYFLGGRVTDYELSIPVRLQGVVDTIHDRRYQIAIVDSASHGLVPAVYTLNREQIFRRGMWQDSLHVTIHVAAMSDTTNYKMRIALVPNADFGVGQAQYQYVDISFTKNLSTAPPLWNNNSKLRRITYSARKCAVFLEVSGITSPDWTDDGTTGILDYWISICKQYFEQHAEYDANGNRIYFE